jgi:copper chaperone CopZ
LRRLVLHLEIDGMIAVHAARALHTALSGIDGLTTANVSLGHAELRYSGNADDAAIRSALESTLELIGLRLASLHIERDRQLPLA